MEDGAYKEELLRLVAEKKIKHTTKYIESATDETLKKIYDEYNLVPRVIFVGAVRK